MAILEVKEVTGGYTRKPVLHDLSFNIGQGELSRFNRPEWGGEKYDD